MDLRESVPTAFTLTVGETSLRLPWPPGPATDLDLGWVRVDGLALDGSRVAAARPMVANGDESDDGAAPFDDATAHLQTQRLAFRAATLATDPARLQAGLDRCALAASGFEELRVWFGKDAPWIGGRVRIGDRQAPFTLRLAVEPGATGTRRVRVFFGDVRLFGALPVPAPLVGASLARALASACRGAAHLAVAGGAIDIAPLDLALVSSLVAWGWRLPDLTPATLRSVFTHAGELRLAFTSASEPADPLDPAQAVGEVGAGASASAHGPGSWLEGERLDDALASAEEKLFTGDVRAAELGYRQLAVSRPDDCAVQARLAALCAAAVTPELRVRARELTRRWPDFVPGWLYAAIGAREADDRDVAAALFTKAAACAAARGESEDARLAREAAAACRAPARSASSPHPTEPAGGGGSKAPTVEAIARALKVGDRETAATLIADHLAESTDPSGRGVLYAEVAELMRVLGAEDFVVLDTLREVSLDASADRALELRVELGELLGDVVEMERALEELITRAVAAGDMPRARALSERTARLEPPRSHAPAVPNAAEGMGSGSITRKTAAVYATVADPEARVGALVDLVRGFDHLPPERQRAAYASFGRVAESTGDLERAEDAYWRGTQVAAQPAQRADFLVAHARLLLSRGNERAAGADLDEALRLAPDHVRALVGRADLAFRSREWEQARQLYARVERASGAAELIPRETLVQRRAVLARVAGDAAEAEACYRELAILDPLQREARQALAEIAAARGDLATAAQRWEEVLRLLPLDAMEGTLDARQQLTDVYAGLGDWGAARHHVELILAQDGGRVAALERAVEVYEQVGLFEEAATACDRLSRLYWEPTRRAQVLYRQGEILQDRLHDEPRAFDAFLKSSDLDPALALTALRLALGFWSRGRFRDVADVAEEIERTGELAQAPLALRLRLAMGAALGRPDAARPGARVELGDAVANPRAAAEALAELALRLSTASPSLDRAATEAALAAAVAVLPGADGAGGGADPRTSIGEALAAMLRDDPAAVEGGAARALAWLADARADVALARALHAIVAFLESGDGDSEGAAARRVAELGLAPVPSPGAFALAGACDDPGVGGAAAPLRRALGSLAHGLAGFGPLAGRATGGGELGLSTERRELLHALGKTMGAPPFGLSLIDLAPAGQELTGNVDVTVRATRPANISIAASALVLPGEELVFSVARALDRLRGGIALIEAVTSGERGDIAALLQGASAALAGGAAPESPLGLAAATELASPDRAAALVGPASRALVASDLASGQALLSGWTTFRVAAERAALRFALLACRSPLAALRALHRQEQTGPRDGANEPGSHAPTPRPPERQRRMAFLRTPALRALVAFMMSAPYLDATRDAARA